MELDTGRRIAEMFDVICGTSAGGLLAMALLLGRSLDEVLYLLLVQKYKKVPVRKELRMLARGTQFTCFTCTNVQILTLRAAD